MPPQGNELARLSSRNRPGYDLDADYSVRCRADAGRECAAGIYPGLSGARPSRARSRRYLVDDVINGARGDCAGRSAHQRYRCPRHHQPARDHGCVGAGHRPPHPQCHRLAGSAHRGCLRRGGHEPAITSRTGLVLDPYFSATKIAWLLDHVEGARAAAQEGRLAFGTVDSFLLWRLTGGRVHATDATNAARTLLMDIHSGNWDAGLCELFGVPNALLPPIRDCADDFGTTDLFSGPIRILGIAGDQQAATVGQGCFAPGMTKSTYGTSCFALLNTGDQPVASKNRLLTTVAYQLGGKRTYALEGSIFIAGAAVQWLRDALKVIGAAPDVNALAAAADPAEQLYLVPAFVGLGAPWWDAQARGALYGLTRKSGVAELARAALEAVGYQTRDLLEAMRADWPGAGANTVLRVDGGMAASDVTMQFVADILATPVDRPAVMETTALGAAYLAGYAAGLCPDLAGFAANAMTRKRKWAGWREAVARTLSRG